MFFWDAAIAAIVAIGSMMGNASRTSHLPDFAPIFFLGIEGRHCRAFAGLHIVVSFRIGASSGWRCNGEDGACRERGSFLRLFLAGLVESR
jgi:hypothetical protein